MKLSTIVNVLDEKSEIVEKEVSVEVDNEMAYFKLEGKDLFELDYENLADFMEGIFKLWSPSVVPKITTEAKP
jgi:TPP-dependent indolepyruvate ferredoxin oxidoreductase alpha subunit